MRKSTEIHVIVDLEMTLAYFFRIPYRQQRAVRCCQISGRQVTGRVSYHLRIMMYIDRYMIIQNENGPSMDMLVTVVLHQRHDLQGSWTF